MDATRLFKQADELGIAGNTKYRGYSKLYHALCGFIDTDYFGVSAYDDEVESWVPMHVNSASNPKPHTDFFGRPCRRKFKKYDLVLHLAAEPCDEKKQFRFLVNSPKNSFHLLGLDIDANDSEKAHGITCSIYHDCFLEHWDYGGHVYIEKSRNRTGRYIWTIIERSSTPAEFNLLVNALSRVLRSKYQIDPSNKFDAIKGTLHYDSREDWDRFIATCDGEINDDHRGLLITMPLAGAVARGTIDAEEDEFLRFVEKRRKKYVNAIPESHLRHLLLRIGPDEFDRFEIEVAEMREVAIASESFPSPSPSPSPPVGNTLRKSAYSAPSESSICDRLIRKAKAEASGKNRMRFASSLHFYTYGTYAPSPEALVAFYKAQGFVAGDDSPAKERSRLRRAREALDDHKANPAKQGFDRSYWIKLVETYVTDEVRQHEGVKYRSPRTKKVMQVEDELLAAGLYVLTLSAFAANRPERLHSCGQEGQEMMYRKLTEAGLITAAFADKRKRVAIPVMLQLAGLVVLRDSRWKFGGAELGCTMKYGLGPNHPRFEEFVGLYGSVVDAKSLSSIVPIAQKSAA